MKHMIYIISILFTTWVNAQDLIVINEPKDSVKYNKKTDEQIQNLKTLTGTWKSVDENYQIKLTLYIKNKIEPNNPYLFYTDYVSGVFQMKKDSTFLSIFGGDILFNYVEGDNPNDLIFYLAETGKGKVIFVDKNTINFEVTEVLDEAMLEKGAIGFIPYATAPQELKDKIKVPIKLTLKRQ